MVAQLLVSRTRNPRRARLNQRNTIFILANTPKPCCHDTMGIYTRHKNRDALVKPPRISQTAQCTPRRALILFFSTDHILCAQPFLFSCPPIDSDAIPPLQFVTTMLHSTYTPRLPLPKLVLIAWQPCFACLRACLFVFPLVTRFLSISLARITTRGARIPPRVIKPTILCCILLVFNCSSLKLTEQGNIFLFYCKTGFIPPVLPPSPAARYPVVVPINFAEA